jgi:cation diffusion facilitator family transporter
MKRADRPPDADHPFGYSKEIYFWAFVVAILIFAVGSGVSIYEGIEKIQHPHPVESPYINYLVLSAAIVFEGAAWTIAFREFRARYGRANLVQALKKSKDPSVVTVLMEDSAAMLGLVVALCGIAAAQFLAMPVFDGIASVTIGLILAGAAIFLAIETKSLLIGEGAEPIIVEGVRRIIAAQSGILKTNEILTMHLGPRDILLNVSIDFHDGVDSVGIERAVSEMERAVKAAHPDVTRIFIESQSWQGHARNVRASGD